MFLNLQKIILEWFLNNQVTMKTGVMATENSALPSHKYIKFSNGLKYKTVILHCNNISQYFLFFLYYWSNKQSW